jgi:hypothetical protein
MPDSQFTLILSVISYLVFTTSFPLSWYSIDSMFEILVKLREDGNYLVVTTLLDHTQGHYFASLPILLGAINDVCDE